MTSHFTHVLINIVNNKGNYCLKIGDNPKFMDYNFDSDPDSALDGGWKFQTLEDCCRQYFDYEFDGTLQLVT